MTCGVPGCETPAADRRPLCSAHWLLVPPYLQSAWWRQQRNPDDEPTKAFVRSASVEAASRAAAEDATVRERPTARGE